MDKNTIINMNELILKNKDNIKVIKNIINTLHLDINENINNIDINKNDIKTLFLENHKLNMFGLGLFLLNIITCIIVLFK